MSTRSRRRSATDRHCHPGEKPGGRRQHGRRLRLHLSGIGFAMTTQNAPDRIMLAPGLEISRLVTGLWQIADMEKDGGTLDLDGSARARWRSMPKRASTLSTWRTTMAVPKTSPAVSMRFTARGEVKSARPVLAHQMVPDARSDDARCRARCRRSGARAPAAPKDRSHAVPLVDVPASGLDRRAERADALRRQEGLIGHLGVTNFDTDHLRLLHEHGIPVRRPTRSASRSSIGARRAR